MTLWNLNSFSSHLRWCGPLHLAFPRRCGTCMHQHSLAHQSHLCSIPLRANSHTRLRARDQFTSSTLIVEKAELVQVRFTLRLRDQRVGECKKDVKSTRILTWHRMDHVSWSLELSSKTTSWRVGLTQNMETMALRMLTSVDLF